MFLGFISLNTLIAVLYLRERRLFLGLLPAFIYSNFPTIFLYLSLLVFPSLLIDAKYYLLSVATIFRYTGITNPYILSPLSQITPFFAWSMLLLIIAIAKTGNTSYKKSIGLAIFVKVINCVPYALTRIW